MAGIDSCTSSVGENLNPHDSIIGDSQNEREQLLERMIISDEALENLWEHFDVAFKNKEYDSRLEIDNTIIFMVGFALGDYGFEFSNIDTFEELNNVFHINGLAPIFSSTSISQNDNGKFILQGSISRLTCNRVVNAINFTPQDGYLYNSDVSIPMYSEILYNFGNGGNKYGAFQYSSKSIYIMSGVIMQEHEEKTEEEKEAYIDVVLANELGHLQFHEIVVPRYGITIENLFEYGGTDYTFQQVDELWSDYSSIRKAYNISKESGNWDITSFELTRIGGRSIGITQYDLTRSVFVELLDQKLEWDIFFQELETRIIAILESAKN